LLFKKIDLTTFNYDLSTLSNNKYQKQL
jgi:hypothetical protein